MKEKADKKFELATGERPLLRAEIQHFKDCQLKYFTLSITATGVLIGLGAKLGTDSEYPSLFFLLPLIIVLPCWGIFFDKATSITRIVGYYRVLETFLLSGKEEYLYIGWENALALGRRFDKKTKNEKIQKPSKTQTYWFLTYATFFSLAVLSNSFSVIVFLSSGGPRASLYIILIASIATAATAMSSGRLVYHLMHGSKSYHYNESHWKELLSVNGEYAKCFLKK